MPANYVEIFNNLVTQAIAAGLTKYKPVKRFSSTSSAVKRIDVLQREIKVAQENNLMSKSDIKNGERKVLEAVCEGVEVTKIPNGTKGQVRKKKKTSKAKVIVVKDDSLQAQILGSRVEKTKKAKLLNHLIENEGKVIPVKTLVTAVYGNASKASVGAFGMVMGGLIRTMTDKKVPYLIERGKNDKETTYVLRAKK